MLESIKEVLWGFFFIEFYSGVGNIICGYLFTDVRYIILIDIREVENSLPRWGMSDRPGRGFFLLGNLNLDEV